MKNILFIHSSSELYGSDRSLLNIVKHINKDKFKIFVILPCQGPLVDEIKKIPQVSIEIFEVAVLRRKNLSIKGGIRYLKEFIDSIDFLNNYIKRNRIDIIDTNTAVVFPGAIVAKRLGKKSVWHIREIIKSNFENKLISFMMNCYADIIIANSIATGKRLKVSQDKVCVVYNAVEEKSIKLNQIKCNGLSIGMAGRINRWKGQKLLVDAAEIVHKKLPDVVFKIAGEAYVGEEYIKEDLKKYIEKKGLSETVFLLGQVDDMAVFYSSIDLFVLPSIQPEPFGLVVIEAMEYGIPVIATNHGGPVEIIENGVDGYLVDYKDCKEMAECILELLSDGEKRKMLGYKGQEKKRAMFSVSTMVENIENIFNN